MQLIKAIIFAVLVGVAAWFCLSTPVRSMLAANETEILEEEGIVPVEYIQSTGLEYIVLDDIVSDSDAISVQYARTSVSDSPTICAAKWLDSTAEAFSIHHGRNNNILSRQEIILIGLVEESTRFSDWISGANMQTKAFTITIDVRNRQWIAWNGVVRNLLTDKSMGNSRALGLFCRATNDGVDRISRLKMYQFEWDRDGVPIYLLTPVRFLNENYEWEGAMYDLVSGELFLNQGTGSFIVGPDL